MTQEIPQIHGEVRWFTERLEPGKSDGPTDTETSPPASEDNPGGYSLIVTQGESTVPRNAEDASRAIQRPIPSTAPVAKDRSSGVVMIPIESINVANPRERNKRKFGEIVDNIASIGLKRPITLRRLPNGTYDLVCGQGRLEALRQLGETMVPAIVRDISQEEALLMSLVENIARKQPTSMDTVRHLVELRDKGYNKSQIAEKTGLVHDYVGNLITLYEHGEERLLSAVESGSISITAAVIIAGSEGADVQSALLEAAQNNRLSSRELRQARSIADMRRAFGKNRYQQTKRGPKQVTGDSIVRAFKREQERQRTALKKAELCEKRLIFTVNALKALLKDDNFINLLRAEGIETMPEYLAQQMKRGENNG